MNTSKLTLNIARPLAAFASALLLFPMLVSLTKISGTDFWIKSPHRRSKFQWEVGLLEAVKFIYV